MDLMQRVLRRIAANLEARAAIARLERLDDRLLADIGIARADIRHLTREAAQKAETEPTGPGRARPGDVPSGRLAAA
jgi:uncharacterized protein YjiS (DUF1127 family)